MTDEIIVLSVFAEMLVKMSQTRRVQKDCSRFCDQPWRLNDHRQWHGVTVGHQSNPMSSDGRR